MAEENSIPAPPQLTTQESSSSTSLTSPAPSHSVSSSSSTAEPPLTPISSIIASGSSDAVSAFLSSPSPFASLTDTNANPFAAILQSSSPATSTESIPSPATDSESTVASAAPVPVPVPADSQLIHAAQPATEISENADEGAVSASALPVEDSSSSSSMSNPNAVPQATGSASSENASPAPASVAAATVSSSSASASESLPAATKSGSVSNPASVATSASSSATNSPNQSSPATPSSSTSKSSGPPPPKPAAATSSTAPATAAVPSPAKKAAAAGATTPATAAAKPRSDSSSLNPPPTTSTLKKDSSAPSISALKFPAPPVAAAGPNSASTSSTSSGSGGGLNVDWTAVMTLGLSTLVSSGNRPANLNEWLLDPAIDIPTTLFTTPPILDNGEHAQPALTNPPPGFPNFISLLPPLPPASSPLRYGWIDEYGDYHPQPNANMNDLKKINPRVVKAKETAKEILASILTTVENNESGKELGSPRLSGVIQKQLSVEAGEKQGKAALPTGKTPIHVASATAPATTANEAGKDAKKGNVTIVTVQASTATSVDDDPIDL